MRITINHRDQGGGRYFVDCKIEFSEEEREIIATRALREQPITRTGVRTESAVAGMGTGCLAWGLRIVSACLFFAGLLAWLADKMTGVAGPGGIMMFFGVVGFVGSFFLAITSEVTADWADAKNDTITIGDVIKRGAFSVLASSPAHAKAAEEKLREDLTMLKVLLAGSAELGKSKTFEL